MNEFQRRIGVGEPSRTFLRHKGGTKTTPVVTQEGRRRGTVGGVQTEHWDGRVDATVKAPAVHATICGKSREIVYE